MKEIYRYFTIDQREIAFLQYTVEAYEGVAVVRTVDPTEGIVELIIAPDFEQEADEMVHQLSSEVKIQEIQVDVPREKWDSLKHHPTEST